MTWAERIEHVHSLHDDTYFADHLPRVIAQRQAAASTGAWGAADRLGSMIAGLIPIRHSAELRQLFSSLQTVVPGAVAAYLRKSEGDHDISTMIFEMTDATNAFECIGFEVPQAVLESFRPYLTRVMDEPDIIKDRWSKGLVALALDERWVWAPIAGYLPDQPVPFVPGQQFGPNMQGLIAYLGGARLAGASFADVEPAWRSFMAMANSLFAIRHTNYNIILWVARIVFHHIGGRPLGTVADLLHDDIQRCVAEGV